MKIDNLATHALGELRAAAREDSKKNLHNRANFSVSWRRRPLFVRSSRAPPAEQSLDEMTRANLREECLRNLRIVRREQNFRRAALAGAVGALAACLLLAPSCPMDSGSLSPARAQTQQAPATSSLHYRRWSQRQRRRIVRRQAASWRPSNQSRSGFWSAKRARPYSRSFSSPSPVGHTGGRERAGCNPGTCCVSIQNPIQRRRFEPLEHRYRGWYGFWQNHRAPRAQTSYRRGIQHRSGR